MAGIMMLSRACTARSASCTHASLASTSRYAGCSSRALSGAASPSDQAAAPTLVKSLQAGLKNAMRAKDSARAQVLKSAIADIQAMQHEKSPPPQIQTLLSSLSQRREALKIYSDQNRQDLVDQFTREIAVLDEFVPEEAKELSLEELNKLIQESIQELGATGDPKSLGKVVKHVKTRAGIRASNMGKELAEAVKKALSA